jgi:hypothetical protein
MDDISLDELKEMSVSRVDLSSVPSEVVGTIKKVEKREDKRNRECIFITVSYQDGDVVFKYTPMHIGELAKALEKLGIKSTSDLERARKGVGNNIAFVRKRNWCP